MSAAYPRDGEPYIDASGETWKGVSWALMFFQIVAIIAAGLLLSFLVRLW